MQTMKLHCCRVPACKVLKHKGKPPGKLLAGGRKHGKEWQGKAAPTAGCRQHSLGRRRPE